MPLETRLRKPSRLRKFRVAAVPYRAYVPSMEENYHFTLIRRALDVIDTHAQQGPLSLEALSKEVGLSPAHFQRLFSQWVGVSPKRYQQYLHIDHARELLNSRHSVLDTAHSVGLSGGGRLHDLFVTWEAMSPGEYARGGSGLTIYTGWFDSPFGPALIMGTDRGICGLAFAAEMGRTEAYSDLTGRWPNATFVEDKIRLLPWAEAAFLTHKETPLHLIGAPFQIKVWEALLAIPSGHVSTYSDLAAAIGNPKAVRAVGTAVGRNPISLLIPCHRALRKSGGLGGYHWGLPVKRAILAYESARLEALDT